MYQPSGMYYYHYGYPPNYPMHGVFKNFQEFVNNLQKAIKDEAMAIEMYEQMLKMAPAEHKKHIRHALEDERKHYQMFTDLYQFLTGMKPMITVPPVHVECYEEAVEEAFQRELEAAELYRDMMLSTSDYQVRDIMFEAMTDEMEHATRFAFIYADLE
ncbi:ferritin-like domain-containing protein [Calderihabitans maritimus]|uniref:Uncharacterized protein n=1 Tax=Calderihabitans maritimus TaxID=1246530 RepID=A0A1Z5HXD8_9FIRM|nr:ferritin-like domain-containing protein [Calderihabitans maritimus]GAW94199.1 hypothetical protein KKC1_33120 [Calderihabitans maritimus]